MAIVRGRKRRPRLCGETRRCSCALRTDGRLMTPLRIFISSVQKELAREREALRDYLRGDSLT